MNQIFYDKLINIVAPEYVFTQEPMKNHTTFRIGGPADWFVMPETKEQVRDLMALAEEEGIDVYVIGNGSNLLVGDGGIRGLVIQIGRIFSEIVIEDDVLNAKAGDSLAKIAQKAYDAGLTGLEFASGLDLTKDADFSRFMTTQQVSYDAISNYYRWKAVLDISSIREKEKGALTSLVVKKRNEAGYVTELELIYQDRTELIKKENEIRKVLGKYIREIILQNEQVRTDLTMLPSACFEVLVNADGQIVLRGGGNGHGIGMSQYGARGMAEKGYTYKEILDYYYENVIVKKF